MNAATLLRGELPVWAAHRGNGYGDGNGNGNGNGDGNGNGYGYGDGNGNGYGSYWLATVSFFARRWSDAQRARLEELRSLGARLAFWKSTTAGKAANGGRCDPVAPGTVHTEPGPLRDECGHGQLHATLLPATKWRGDRWWVVAFIGETRGDDEKLWGLHREVIGECL